MKNRFQLLFSAEPEALGGAGSSASPALTVVTDDAAAGDDAPAAEAETKPGYLETIRASLQSKAALLSDRDAYLSRATAAEAKVKDLEAQLASSAGELATLRHEKAEIVKLLDGMEKEKATVELSAARTVAAMGFEAEKLPAPEAGDGNSVEALEAKLERETNPQEIVKLARQIDALKAKNAE